MENKIIDKGELREQAIKEFKQASANLVLSIELLTNCENDISLLKERERELNKALNQVKKLNNGLEM